MVILLSITLLCYGFGTSYDFGLVKLEIDSG